jgi:hypothetical protein
VTEKNEMADAKNALASKMQGNYFNPSEMYDSLMEQNALPAWVQIKPYQSAGTYYPNAHAFVARSGDKPTIAHEMSHAYKEVMNRAASLLREREFQKKELNPAESQFLDAYLRTFGNLPGKVGQYGDRGDPVQFMKAVTNRINSLYKKEKVSNEYHEYRTSPDEAFAFGVGDTSSPAAWQENSNHLNPTMAQEFAVMMEMYKRLPSSARQSMPSSSWKTDRFNDLSEAVLKSPLTNYANPFK